MMHPPRLGTGRPFTFALILVACSAAFEVFAEGGGAGSEAAAASSIQVAQLEIINDNPDPFRGIIDDGPDPFSCNWAGVTSATAQVWTPLVSCAIARTSEPYQLLVVADDPDPFSANQHTLGGWEDSVRLFVWLDGADSGVIGGLWVTVVD